MKKILFIVMVFAGFTQLANAQKISSNEFSVRVGINGSQITDSYYNSDLIAGLNAGISLDHYFNDRWSLQVGANYQQKGWSHGFVTFDDGTEIDGVNYKLHYLTVPILANWHFGRTRNWYVNFGPYLGFLLDATESSKTVINTKDAFNSVDGGIAAGLGIKFPIGRQSNFFIEYSAQAGVANVIKDSSPSIQNATNSLNVGIAF